MHHIIKHITEDELIREIQLKNQLSELDGSPVPEYDPSDGMDMVEELKRYIRFLYASLQDKDKENSQMRKDMAYREAKNRYPDMDWHPCHQNLLNWEDKGAIMLNMLLPALKDIALEEGVYHVIAKPAGQHVPENIMRLLPEVGAEIRAKVKEDER